MKTIINKVPAFFLICTFLCLGSCKETSRIKRNNQKTEIQNKKESIKNIDRELLIGSWLDSSKAALNFTLFKDGTARSDNMTTLLYRKWSVNGQKLILTAESLGNGTSSIGDESYEIKTLTNKKMVLKNGYSIMIYIKKN